MAVGYVDRKATVAGTGSKSVCLEQWLALLARLEVGVEVAAVEPLGPGAAGSPPPTAKE